MTTKTPLALLMALLAPTLALAAPTTVTFTNVASSAAISVVIKDSGGHLVRTLVSNQRTGTRSGTLSWTWDNTDDFGRAVPAGNYSATLVGNNITYTWEGSIGNTSRDAGVGGPHVYRSYEPITQMAADAAGDVFYTVGYNEQQLNFHRFSSAAPQVPTHIGVDDSGKKFTFVDTDGLHAYYAQVGIASGWSCPNAADPNATVFDDNNKTFVAATVISSGADNDTPYDWAGAGQPVLGGTSGTWLGADVSVNTCQAHYAANGDATYTGDALAGPNRLLHSPSGGVAVQRRGNVLFVAHTDENVVKVLDKTSGTLLATIPVASPASICVAGDDSLWVLSTAGGASLRQYVGGGAAWTSSNLVNSGFGTRPLAIGCNRADNTVAVLDGDSSVVTALGADGNPRWTLGTPGGYSTGGPAVSNTRFGFLPGRSFITFLDDGSFWLSDPVNTRTLQFDAARNFKQQIAYLPANYKIAVHGEAPTRLFAQYLEYAIDYTKTPANQSWTLVRNWAAGLARSTPTTTAPYVPYDSVNFYAGIQQPHTLFNGGTYAVVWHADANGHDGDGVKEIVELNPTTGLRGTGITLPLNTQMYAGGVLRSFVPLPGTQRCGNPCQITERTLAGFDASRNPIWNAPTVVAQASGVNGVDPAHGGNQTQNTLSEAFFPETSDHQLVSFQNDLVAGYHLGAIARNGTAWNWRASLDGPFNIDANGAIVDPKDGHFDIGRGVNYPGGIVATAGTNIVYGYVGEAWNQAEANQIMHFDATGAMLGQFGVAGYPGQQRAVVVPGVSGNSYGLELATITTSVIVPLGMTTSPLSRPSTLYVYKSDENGDGGVTRWRVDGTGNVSRQTVVVVVH